MAEYEERLVYKSEAEKTKDTDSFIIFREVPSYFGRAFIWILAILLVGRFDILFIAAGLSYLILSFLGFGIKNNKSPK